MAESPLATVARILGGVVLMQGNLGHQVLGQLLIIDSNEVAIAAAGLVIAASSRDKNAVTQVALRTAAPALAARFLIQKQSRRLEQRAAQLDDRERRLDGEKSALDEREDDLLARESAVEAIELTKKLAAAPSAAAVEADAAKPPEAAPPPAGVAAPAAAKKRKAVRPGTEKRKSPGDRKVGRPKPKAGKKR